MISPGANNVWIQHMQFSGSVSTAPGSPLLAQPGGPILSQDSTVITAQSVAWGVPLFTLAALAEKSAPWWIPVLEKIWYWLGGIIKFVVGTLLIGMMLFLTGGCVTVNCPETEDPWRWQVTDTTSVPEILPFDRQ